MKRSHLWISILFAALCLTLGFGVGYAFQGQEETPAPVAGEEGDQSVPPDNVAATVNGEPITNDAYQRQLSLAKWALESQGHDLSTEEGQQIFNTLRQQVLEDMINLLLIEQAAASESITVTQKTVDQTVEKTIQDGGGRPGFEQWLKDTGQTEDDYKNMIHSQLLTEAIGNKIIGNLPDKAPQVHARHILVDSEEKAADIIKKLQNGEDFIALSKELSIDQGTKDDGGDLGWFPRQMMPPEIDNIVFSADTGLIAEPVPDAFGTFHVLEVLEKDPQRELTEEQINSLKASAFMRWLAEQRLDAQIERFIEF